MDGATQLSADGTVSVELPAALLHALEKEGKRRHKSVAQIIAQILIDREDYREAEKRMKDVRSGKVKLVDAEDVYKRLGI